MALTKVKLIADKAPVKSFELVDTVVLDGEIFVVPSPKKILVLGDLDVNTGGIVDIEVGAKLITF